MTCIHRIIRIFAFISSLFSIGVIIVNVWIFGSVLFYESNQNGTASGLENVPISYVSDQPNADRYQKNQKIALTETVVEAIQFQKPRKENSTDTLILNIPVKLSSKDGILSVGTVPRTLPNDSESGPSDSASGFNTESHVIVNGEYHHWAQLKRMTGTFKGIILGCTWMAILGGFIQFCSSVPLLFRLSKRMSSVAGCTIGIHFISFTILLICFLAPLTYNRDCYFDSEEQQEETSTTNCSIHLSWAEFTQLTKEKWSNMATNSIHFIRDDLNSYYVAIGADIIVVIVNMFVVSSVLRCSNQSFGGKSYDAFP